MSDIIQNQLKVYRDNFLEYRNSTLGTRQNNTDTQYLRFERILKHILAVAKPGFTIHDVGSGTCDLHAYLLQHQIPHLYSGTEIVEEMITQSKQFYPDIELLNRDILSADPEPQYDFVVLSGTLNIPGDTSIEEWNVFVFKVIKQMFLMCRKAIAFNLLTTHKTFSDPTLFYCDPADVFNYCQKLSRFVNLDHAYPLYEYTVTVFRKEEIARQYPEEAFSKYFRNHV